MMIFDGQNTSSIFGRCKCGQLKKFDRNEVVLSDGECHIEPPYPCQKCQKVHTAIEGFVDVSIDELQQEESKSVAIAAVTRETYAKPVIRRVRCKKCGSDQITANPKGFGLGKAVTGGLIAGPIGLLTGFMGSRTTIVTCLNCGHTWSPSQG